MAKFKVGDRVRYIPCKETGEWQNVTISKIDDGDGIYLGDDPINGTGGFGENQIEVIPPTTNPAAIERCVELVRMAANGWTGDWVEQAKAIMAELEPVDSDLLEARKIAADHCGGNPYMLEGECDGDELVKCALAAIKRGRKLAQENSRG